MVARYGKRSAAITARARSISCGGPRRSVLGWLMTAVPWSRPRRVDRRLFSVLLAAAPAAPPPSPSGAALVSSRFAPIDRAARTACPHEHLLRLPQPLRRAGRQVPEVF